MAAENFKVKKGLEVGTGTTINATGINVTGVVTATQLVGDGSGLTNVVGSGSGVVVKDEGSAVGTAGTINFVGGGVAATLSAGQATITIDSGGLSDIVSDTTPQLGGNLDLNSKDITGSGDIDITGNLNISGISTFGGNATITQDLDVDGHTELDSLNVDGHTELDNLNVSGISTFAGITTVTGETLFTKQLNVSGVSTFQNNVHLLDDDKLLIGGSVGTHDGIEIYHESDQSYIVDSGTGQLFIRGAAAIHLENASGSEKFARFVQNAAAELFFNDTKRFSTSGVGVTVFDQLDVGTGTTVKSSGINVTGIITATSFSGLLVGNVQGNATSASSCSGNAATATEATNVTVTANNSTDETVYPVFVDGATGTQGAETDTGLNYNPSTGNLSATKFTGDGSGLTSIPSAQLSGALPALDGSALTNIAGSGSGIIIRHDGNVVGTASSINFSTNLDVSAISAGIVTVTASGGGSGISTANVVTDTLNVSGVSTLTGNVRIGDNASVSTSNAGDDLVVGNLTGGHGITIVSGQANGNLNFADSGSGNAGAIMYNHSENAMRFRVGGGEKLRITGAGHVGIGTEDPTDAVTSDNTKKLSVGIVSAYQFYGNGLSVAGVATATSFVGSGASLTSLNADNLGSGTIPNGRFPTTLPAVSGANLTNLPAGNLTGTVDIARIADSAVTFAKMQDVGTGVLIGRNDSGGGVMETLTAAEVRTLINVEDGATAGGGISTASSNVQVTFEILSTSSNSNGYRFSGPGNDGNDANPDLYLVRGQRYRFIQNAGSHPFEIQSTAGGSAYSTGVTNNGGNSGNIDFNVQHDAPTRLYYQCTSHGGMIGNIYITGGASWQTTDVNTSTTEEIFTNLNVGIGTDDPESRLTIFERVANSDGVKTLLSLISDKSDMTPGTRSGGAIRFLNQDDNNSAQALIQVNDPDSHSGSEALRERTADFNFKQSSGGLNSLITSLTIKGETGNVGIGTDNPNTKVHISGDSGATNILRIDTDTNAITIHDHSQFVGYIGNDSGKLFINAGGTEDTLSLRTNGASRIQITNSGIDVTGIIKFGTSNISSGTHTFTASAGSAVNVDTTAIGSATAIEYTIFISNGSNIQSQKVLIMDNGTTAYSQEFAMMSNPNMIATFSADVNGGNVRLRATPETGISGSTTIKFSKMIIE